MNILDTLSRQDREILRRKHLLEQPAGQIIKELGLQREGESKEQGEVRLRLLASRAKARLALKVQSSLERRYSTPIPMSGQGEENGRGNGESGRGASR
jgi:hypothetical protein